MRREHRKPAILGIVGSIGFSVAARALRPFGYPEVGVAYLPGVALMLWGCYHLVRGKGYTPYLCVIALLPIVGLLALLLLPDRHPLSRIPEPISPLKCPNCGQSYRPTDHRRDASSWEYCAARGL